ncbi:WD40 repeat-like protein [Imleria badia]|nr:WD40 repeat-like protein [Imleria badia]
MAVARVQEPKRVPGCHRRRQVCTSSRIKWLSVVLTGEEEHPRVIDTGAHGKIFSVAFHPDGRHLLAGGADKAVRQWDVETGQEVGESMEMASEVDAIAVSRDHKWIVSGNDRTTSVWDAKTHQKVVEVDKEARECTVEVDVHPNSSRFATGRYYEKSVTIWDITTGERLLGPLEHDGLLVGVKFSPSGDHIAAASQSSIRVFDSRNGNQLIGIDISMPKWAPMTPLAWSNDGQQIFTASHDRRLRSFDVTTGSQLAESAIHDHDVPSIALATGNGKFMSTFAGTVISFWDTSTFTQIGPAIQNTDTPRSIAISLDGSYLATGGDNGKITVRSLAGILPESYGPFNASPQEERGSEGPKDAQEQQPGEQLSTSGVKDNKVPDPSSAREEPTPSSHSHPPESETHSDDNALLEVELPSSTPRPLFNYDEPPSPASSTHRNAEVPPLDPSHADPPPTIPAIETTIPEKPLDTSKSTEATQRRTFRTRSMELAGLRPVPIAEPSPASADSDESTWKLEIKDSGHSIAYSVAFYPDGKHLLSAGGNGIRQWQVSDGREVPLGSQSFQGHNVYAISLSSDHKWIVKGSEQGTSVWDAKDSDKVHQVGPSNNFVITVDISPDSTKFATGTGSRGTDPHCVNVWDITTGERLVGPLEHDDVIVGVKFSPNGNHIATLTQNHHIRVFNSRNGDQLIKFNNQMPAWSALTPIVWLSDGQLFAISKGGKIKSFDTSTGSQLAEWKIHSDDIDDLISIALSPNNKFIASSAGRSVSFWDTSTHTQLGSVLKDVDRIRSIALSPDGTHLATGGFNGTITIWNLRGILPEAYLPITVSPDSERPRDDGSHPNPPELETGSRDDDDDDALLEVELQPRTSAPLFNYDEPPSPLAESHESPLNPAALPSDSSQAKTHPPPDPPIISSLELPDSESNPVNAESSEGNQRRTIGGWFKTMMKRGSHNRTLQQTPSEESPQVGPSNEKRSTITLGKRVQRTVGRSTVRPQKKAAQIPAASTQPAAKATPLSEAGPANVPDETKPETSGVQRNVERGTGRTLAYNLNVAFSLSVSIPSWICCVRVDTGD